MNRRTFVATLSWSLLLGGCLGRSTPGRKSGTTNQSRTSETDEIEANLTEWERSTDCHEERNGMYDSVIEVARVRSTIGDGYAPIRFSNLSSEEKEILRTVTEEGGYGTCDTSDAFGRFVERVTERTERQEDDRHVYLERDGTYYGLYVEITDQVFVY